MKLNVRKGHLLGLNFDSLSKNQSFASLIAGFFWGWSLVRIGGFRYIFPSLPHWMGRTGKYIHSLGLGSSSVFEPDLSFRKEQTNLNPKLKDQQKYNKVNRCWISWIVKPFINRLHRQRRRYNLLALRKNIINNDYSLIRDRRSIGEQGEDTSDKYKDTVSWGWWRWGGGGGGEGRSPATNSNLIPQEAEERLRVPRLEGAPDIGIW